MSASGRNAPRPGVAGEAQAVRRRQVLLFSAIAGIALVVLALWLTAGGGGKDAQTPRIEAELAGPDTAEESWTRRSEARIGTIETRIRELETEARQLRSQNERLRERLAADAADARAVIDRQAAIIDDFDRRMDTAPAPPGALFPGDAGLAQDTPSAPEPEPLRTAPLIETFELEGGGRGRARKRLPPVVEVAGYVAPRGRARRSGGACRCGRRGRRQQPGRSAPGAAAPDGPGVDRGASVFRGRDRAPG